MFFTRLIAAQTVCALSAFGRGSQREYWGRDSLPRRIRTEQAEASRSRKEIRYVWGINTLSPLRGKEQQRGGSWRLPHVGGAATSDSAPVTRMTAKVKKLTICSAKEAAAETMSNARKLFHPSASERDSSRDVLSLGMSASAASVAADASAVAGGAASAAGARASDDEEPSPDAARAATRRTALEGSLWLEAAARERGRGLLWAGREGAELKWWLATEGAQPARARGPRRAQALGRSAAGAEASPRAPPAVMSRQPKQKL